MAQIGAEYQLLTSESENRANFRFHGVGEEAFLVGLVMEFGEFFRGDLDSLCEGRFWVEFDSGEDGLSALAFFQESDGVVGVGLEGELLKGAEGEESEHVAAGKGADVGLLGIRQFRGAEVLGGGGGLDADSVAEVEGVIAGVFLIAEGAAVAIPGEGNTVIGHDDEALWAGRSINEDQGEVKWSVMEPRNKL